MTTGIALPLSLGFRMSGLRQGPPDPVPQASTVRKNLFGPIDHDENLKFVQDELNKISQQDCKKWNFDFQAEKPKEGRYSWQPVSEKVPQAYEMRAMSCSHGGMAAPIATATAAGSTELRPTSPDVAATSRTAAPPSRLPQRSPTTPTPPQPPTTRLATISSTTQPSKPTTATPVPDPTTPSTSREEPTLTTISTTPSSATTTLQDATAVISTTTTSTNTTASTLRPVATRIGGAGVPAATAFTTTTLSKARKRGVGGECGGGDGDGGGLKKRRPATKTTTQQAPISAYMKVTRRRGTKRPLANTLEEEDAPPALVKRSCPSPPSTSS